MNASKYLESILIAFSSESFDSNNPNTDDLTISVIERGANTGGNAKSAGDLLNVEDYTTLLKKSGFTNIIGKDKTLHFIKILQNELNNLGTAPLNKKDKNSMRKRKSIFDRTSGIFA